MSRAKRENSIEKTCEQCGVVFKVWASRAKNGQGRFSSTKCRGASQKIRSEKICDWCGKSFTVTPYQIKSNEGKYCSKSCSNLGRQDRVLVTCDYCGKQLERRRTHASRGTKHRFCNYECQYAYAHKNWPKGEDNWTYRGRVTIQCSNCGKELERRPGHVKNYRYQFCDMVCRSEFYSGDMNYRWKDGQHIKYYGPNWQRQRKAARKRDDYTCQHCGTTEKEVGKELSVHHIRPFKEFGYVPEGPDKNDNYKEANTLTNLVSLCPSCHTRIEIQTRLSSS